jgi:hypothetical protein
LVRLAPYASTSANKQNAPVMKETNTMSPAGIGRSIADATDFTCFGPARFDLDQRMILATS